MLFSFKYFYIILGFYGFVNNLASNTLKNINEFSGAGRETCSGLPKISQKMSANLLTTPQKYDILSITLLYFGGRELYYFSTEFYHFTTEFYYLAPNADPIYKG